MTTSDLQVMRFD